MASYAYPSPVGPSTLDQLMARTASIIPAGDYMVDFDDLTGAVLASNWTVGGSPANDLTHGPGVWTFPNTANTYLVKPTATVANGAATRWHAAARVRFPTALSAAERFSFGLCKDGALTDFAFAGTRQASSGTKFVFSVSKASSVINVLSTVSIDLTNFHVLEVWFDGTNVYGSVDNESPVLVTAAANVPTTVLTPTHWLIATANAGGFSAYIDYLYSAAARTAT